ncbi:MULTISPECIES: DUF3742 family protein [Pseudomonas]|uniref:DUF3742 family protein n=1 Tax=Pseudomonas TaxID=286 RepID=UPI00236218DF|nr:MULTISPECIES: DUF3742 family protein [Pseudomonas]WJV25592.1 DUF3742 family protein [Pseudomonas chlororaphis]
MSSAKKMTTAERAGHAVGRWLKSVVRLESSVVHKFVAIGVPRWLALALKWTLRLALAAALLYIAFVPAVFILLIVLFLMRSSGTEAPDDEEWNQMVDIDFALKQEQQRLEDIEIAEASRRGNDHSEWWQP